MLVAARVSLARLQVEDNGSLLAACGKFDKCFKIVPWRPAKNTRKLKEAAGRWKGNVRQNWDTFYSPIENRVYQQVEEGWKVWRGRGHEGRLATARFVSGRCAPCTSILSKGSSHVSDL